MAGLFVFKVQSLAMQSLRNLNLQKDSQFLSGCRNDELMWMLFPQTTEETERRKERGFRAPIDPIGCSSLSVFCSIPLSPLLTLPPSLPLNPLFNHFVPLRTTATVRQLGMVGYHGLFSIFGPNNASLSAVQLVSRIQLPPKNRPWSLPGERITFQFRG